MSQEESDEVDDVIIKISPALHSEGKRKLMWYINYVSDSSSEVH